MSFFKLTIAEDDIEKRTEGYTNLMSMLYGFSIAISVTLVSGFWYYFVPRDLNWNASQTVLVLHLAGGLISLILFLVYFFLHQKDKEQSPSAVLAPWKQGTKKDETSQHFQQRQLGYSLTWVFFIIFGSGLLISIPGVLFYFGALWMQGYYVSQTLVGVHFWASVLLVPILFTHMLWIARRGT